MSQPDEPIPRYVFEIRDWQGRVVRMTQKTFDNHRERHAEIPDYIEEAKATIRDPDRVYKGDVGRSLHLYRYGLGRGIYARTYLAVIVYMPIPLAPKSAVPDEDGREWLFRHPTGRSRLGK